jgi:hypothetical protein
MSQRRWCASLEEVAVTGYGFLNFNVEVGPG